MESFKVNNLSVIGCIVALVAIFCGGYIIKINVPQLRGAGWIGIPYLVVLTLVSNFLSKWVSESPLLIEMDGETINIHQFRSAFKNEETVQRIRLEELAEFRFKSDQMFDSIRLKLLNGSKIRIWHHNMLSKDEFYGFVSALDARLTEFNEHHVAAVAIVRK